MRKSVAVDTNLLLLLIVGKSDRRYIKSHKKTKSYNLDDFDLLLRILSKYQKIIITPNVLTETSNLASHINDESAKEAIFRTLAALISRYDEQYVISKDASLRREFIRLGLSDSALLEVNKAGVVMLTADRDLHLAAEKAGYKSINFNHIREAAWDAASQGY
jgi:rRNA-processing protein FCF1